MNLTVNALLCEAEKKLAQCSDSPQADARYLLAHILGETLGSIRAYGDRIVGEVHENAFWVCVTRRLQGEPVAYIAGKQGFWKNELITTCDTLIPRPETELLVERILSLLCDMLDACVLDLGTGTGAIALSLAQEKPTWHVMASDFSEKALKVAQQNADALQINNIEFRQGSWCLPWHDSVGVFDVVVSNPPYVCENDPHLKSGDVQFEPVAALVSGSDGLDAIREITLCAKKLLKKSGWLFIEHGFDQAQAVRDIFAHNGYIEVETIQDINGHDRVCKGQWI